MTRLADRRTGTCGFTLIEVAAALAIFSLIAAGIAVNSVAVTRYNRVSNNLSAAISLAQDRVEQLRALDPTTSPAALTAGTHTDALNPLTQNGNTGGRFVRQWTVTRDMPVLGVSTVVVSVSWTDGTSRTVHMSTLVCQTAGCV